MIRLAYVCKKIGVDKDYCEKSFTPDHNLCWISWGFPKEKLNDFCKELKNSVGDEYSVFVPESEWYNIAVVRNGSYNTDELRRYVLSKRVYAEL